MVSEEKIQALMAKTGKPREEVLALLGTTQAPPPPAVPRTAAPGAKSAAVAPAPPPVDPTVAELSVLLSVANAGNGQLITPALAEAIWLLTARLCPTYRVFEMDARGFTSSEEGEDDGDDEADAAEDEGGSGGTDGAAEAAPLGPRKKRRRGRAARRRVAPPAGGPGPRVEDAPASGAAAPSA